MQKATLIIYSEAIFTGLTEKPISGGIAINLDKILYVGRKDQLDSYKGEDTIIKDYGDSLVMPGFVDAHDHFMQGAQFTSKHFCSTLNKAHSEEECVLMMVEFAKQYPDLDRYFGYGWLPSYWGENAVFPTKRSLDKHFPDKPVYLRAVDGHSEWMNSAALKESGYTKDWKPAFGSVDTFPDGELNGLVREGGDLLARKYDILLPDEEVELLQRNFMRLLNAKGITTFTEMSAYLPEDIDSSYEFVKKMDDAGEMTVRLFLYPGTDIDPDRISEIAPFRDKYDSDTLRINGLKGFADGVTSTYTAAMLEPYTDKPDDSGYLNYPANQYHAWVKEANRQGYGTRVHCIGDLAVRTLLDAYEESNRCNDNSKLRNTIEHIEVINPQDIFRFKELGVVPSMQPLHLPLDEFDKIYRCGVKRSHYEWIHKTILDTGAILAIGTDYPVADFDPIPNVYNAITRKGMNGVQYGEYTAKEKLSLEETLKAYTYGSAYALKMEDKIGTLEPGKYADIAIMDKNLFAIPEDDILDTQIVLTIMNGNIVYEKGN